MTTRHVLAAAVMAVVLSRCCWQQSATDTPDIASVQSEIKRQIAVYMMAAQPSDKKGKAEMWCGSGNVDFDISSVKVQLTTTLATNTTTGAGATIPLPVALSGLTLSAGTQNSSSNTQTLTYNLWPDEPQTQDFQKALKKFKTEILDNDAKRAEVLNSAPIARLLLDLRKGLIQGAMKAKGKEVGLPGEKDENGKYKDFPQPCFTDYDPNKLVSSNVSGSDSADAQASDSSGSGGDTVTVGLQFVKGSTAGAGVAGLSVQPALLNISASGGSTSTTGQTLTVTFVQRGLDALKEKKAAAMKAASAMQTACDASAKTDDGSKSKCVAATAAAKAAQDAYENAREGVGVETR